MLSTVMEDVKLHHYHRGHIVTLVIAMDDI